MRENNTLSENWQVPLIIVIGIILVVLAAFLLTQIDNIQRRSLLPPKRLAIVDEEAANGEKDLEIVYLPGDEVVTATPSPTPESLSPTPSGTLDGTAVSVLVPTCGAAPEDWTPYIVQQGDSLSSLAIKYGVNKKTIAQANCLAYEQIIRGQLIYIPQDMASNTNQVNCGAPQGWLHYVVHPGDTLLKLAEDHNSTIYLIMNANCLESTYLAAGRKLFLPPPQATQIVPTRQFPSPTQPRPQLTVTATWTRQFIQTPTSTPTFFPYVTETATSIIITTTPTPTLTPWPTETSTVTPSPITPTATEVTPTLVPTTIPSETPTAIPSITPTQIVPTATETAAPLPTETNTPLPPTPTPTSILFPPSPTSTVPVHPPAQPTTTPTPTIDPYPS